MADTQIGSPIGVTSVGRRTSGLEIGADGANNVTLASPAIDNTKVRVSSFIDIVNKNTGAVLASNRLVVSMDFNGVLTYSGANVDSTPGTHVVVPTGQTPAVSGLAANVYTNLNGGNDAQNGFNLRGILSMDVGGMKEYLLSLSKTAYTAASLNQMTYNDLVYACRQEAAPTSIK